MAGCPPMWVYWQAGVRGFWGGCLKWERGVRAMCSGDSIGDEVWS
ncbi:MAG: hypothetical protein VXZ49_06205 [Planctomycetota bacterium]|nr:hypothetical protein [Planctomycetota bacterium]